MVQKDEWDQRCKKEKSQTSEDEKTSQNIVYSSYFLSMYVTVFDSTFFSF